MTLAQVAPRQLPRRLPSRHVRIASAPSLAIRLSDPEFCGRTLALVVAAIWVAGLVVGFVAALRVLVVVAMGGAVVGVRYPTVGLLAVALMSTLDISAGNWIFTGGLWRFNTFNYWLLSLIFVNGRTVMKMT